MWEVKTRPRHRSEPFELWAKMENWKSTTILGQNRRMFSSLIGIWNWYWMGMMGVPTTMIMTTAMAHGALSLSPVGVGWSYTEGEEGYSHSNLVIVKPFMFIFVDSVDYAYHASSASSSSSKANTKIVTSATPILTRWSSHCDQKYVELWTRFDHDDHQHDYGDDHQHDNDNDHHNVKEQQEASAHLVEALLQVTELMPYFLPGRW